MHKIPVITIDGPSGSGKGTISTLLASRLGWHFLDSGKIYRLLALACLDANIDITMASKVAKIANELQIKFSHSEGKNIIYLKNQDVSKKILEEKVGNCASIVAAHSEIRTILLQQQRNFRKSPGLVADGRDMGTVVFPDADLKFFLEASANIRAKRRQKQLSEIGKYVNIRELEREITERDERDRNRKTSPLIPALDAITIDTSDLNIAEVGDRVLQFVRAKFSF